MSVNDINKATLSTTYTDISSQTSSNSYPAIISDFASSLATQSTNSTYYENDVKMFQIKMYNF